MDYSEFKEKVKAATDIVDVIGKYVDLKRSGSSYKGLCPFHGEKTPSFFVMPDDQYFYCHGCHKGGDVFQFICEHNNVDFKEAVEELAMAAGIDVPEKFESGGDAMAKKGLKNRLYAIYKSAAGFYYSQLHSEDGRRGYDYLTSRKISKNMMSAFGLGYAPGSGDALYRYLKEEGHEDEILRESGLFSYKSGRPRDFFFNRVIFPVMDRSSRVIAFGGRIMGDGQPKYLNSPETPIFSKKNNLYGIHRAVKIRSERTLLVEGYMDVISSHQAGFSEAVASLGTALTEEQAYIIARMAKRVYLIYDADTAGTNAMLRAIPMLRGAGLFVNVVSMKPYKDPDELIKEEGPDGFEQRIRNSENAFYFELECLAAGYDRSDPSENASFQQKVAEKIAGFSDKFERSQYIEAVSERFSVDRTLLRSEVDRIGGENWQKGGIIPKKIFDRVEKLPSVGKKADISKEYADEKNILSALIKEPAYFSKVREYIGPEDFAEGMLRDLAVFVFEGLSGAGIKVSDIMGHYEGEDQSEVGRIFYDSFFDELDVRAREKFLADSVKTMLIRANNRRLADCSNDEFMKLIEEKKRLEKLDIKFD